MNKKNHDRLDRETGGLWSLSVRPSLPLARTEWGLKSRKCVSLGKGWEEEEEDEDEEAG